MTISFQREALARVRPDITELTVAHWEEVAHDKASRQLDPNWPAFEAMEAGGNLFVMTARADGQLIGYVAAMMQPHLNSRATRIALVQNIFLLAEYRRNNAGVRILQLADLALQELVDFIYWHIKPERDFTPLLKRLGYHYVEAVWGRATGRGVL
jgi:L-amino acid N-acyltransferase YncA